MFWEGKKLWTAENFQVLLDCLRNHSQSFTGEELMQLLEGASADVKHLATEVRWLEYLSEPGTSVATKISALRAMWDWLGEHYPEDRPLLADAMLVGVVKTNMSSHRCYEYRCLSERIIDWASLPADRQNGLMEDPWKFGLWVHSKEDPRPRMLPHVLCYFLFPDNFEPIGSDRGKAQVVREAVQHHGVQAITDDSDPDVRYPREGSKSRKVWNIADSMPDASRKEVIEVCTQQQLNWHTASTQYNRWKNARRGLLGDPIAIDRSLLRIRRLLEAKNPGVEVDLLDHSWSPTRPPPEPPPDLPVDYEAWCRRRFGDTRVWLLGTGRDGEMWPRFRDDGVASVGWEDIGDLTELGCVWPEILRALIDTGAYEARPTNITGALSNFCGKVEVGDTIIARRGRQQILGVGKVASDYYYDSSRQDHWHTRRVHWNACEPPVDIPKERQGIAAKALTPITNWKKWLYVVVGLIDRAVGPPTPPEPYGVDEALADLFINSERFRQILSVFRSRKNLILQGPPGTGKTFMARRLAWCLLERKDSGPIEMVQFHQSYAYEDFVQGYRPTKTGGFTLRNGVFYEFCERARYDSSTPYVFIIDEINRGNMSRIFGELLMLIEADKRTDEYAASLTYGKAGDRFFVPPNVYILGMMNTADRSLAVVDYALRRRFAFEELTPAFSSPKFRRHLVDDNGIDPELVDVIRKRMDALNRKIREDSELGSGFEIGHSYFVPNEAGEGSDTWYDDIVKTQIAPLLREYWFDRSGDAERAVKDLLAGGS